MQFSPHYWTTTVGSFPHLDSETITSRLVETLDVPAWPQLPRRTFLEGMYVQYTPALPAVVVDEAREKVFFDTSGDLTPALEVFYESYLADDLDYFALQPAYAQGFFTFLDTLRLAPTNPERPWAKGQVTGPISLGLTVTDQDLRASLYHDLLADPLVKNAALNARWQVRQLKQLRPNVIIFVDEPYLASFGSAYISLNREQVITMLDEVFDGIHAEGALAGVHCCANTDWSVLMATQVDILNLDAYGYLENLALYPAELRLFLDRGGVVAWGFVPNTEAIFQTNPAELAGKLNAGFELIQEKARGRGLELSSEQLATRSLVTTNCGLGPTTVEVANRSLLVLKELGEHLNSGS